MYTKYIAVAEVIKQLTYDKESSEYPWDKLLLAEAHSLNPALVADMLNRAYARGRQHVLMDVKDFLGSIPE